MPPTGNSPAVGMPGRQDLAAYDSVADAADTTRHLDWPESSSYRADNGYSDAWAPQAVELDEFLAQSDREYDWLIPGLIERHDRMIWTGEEGAGKSTWCRQNAVQYASGIHPFGGLSFAPLRVLLVDLENTESQIRREIRPLRITAGSSYAGSLFVKARPEGLDLLHGSDYKWLRTEVEAARPDVLITGPLYKMFVGPGKDDEPARACQMVLDKIRVDYGCALQIEAHSAKGNGDHRPIEPYGSSLWLRWPEFGMHLGALGAIQSWRGHRDRMRDWPRSVKKGGEWPWAPLPLDDDGRRGKVRLLAESGMPQRQIAAAVGMSQTDVNRLLKGW